MFYRRRLPHWQEPGRSVFVTFRLHGSFPPRPDGPTWLALPEITKVVEEALSHGQGLQYDLYAYVVMNNHVHALFYPKTDLTKIMQSLKSFTARRANAMLGRSGPFWQMESFDHWIRDLAEFRETADYIENNPVRSGLVARAEDFPWSSAGKAISIEKPAR